MADRCVLRLRDLEHFTEMVPEGLSSSTSSRHIQVIVFAFDCCCLRTPWDWLSWLGSPTPSRHKQVIAFS